MLLSRANLAVAACVADGPGRYALEGVLLARDGTTVAADGAMLMAVEGVHDRDLDESVPEYMNSARVPAAGVILPAELCRDTLKGLPKRARHARPFVAYAGLARCDAMPTEGESETGADGPGVHELELVTTDGDNVNRRAATDVSGQFPNYPEVMPRGTPAVRFCLGARLLDTLLKALKTAGATCPENQGVEFTVYDHKTPVVVRSHVPATGQHIMALIAPVAREDGLEYGADGERVLTYWDTALARDPVEELADECDLALSAILTGARAGDDSDGIAVDRVLAVPAAGAGDAGAELARLAVGARKGNGGAPA